MLTLGEFIARAQAYGYTKRVIDLPELQARLVYLAWTRQRRQAGGPAADS
jgi:hypothetical protein